MPIVPVRLLAALLASSLATAAAALPRCVPPCWNGPVREHGPITAGDLNGDGRADVVTQDPHFSCCERHLWFSGPSGPPWIPSVRIVSPVGPEVGLAQATGDLDGDGIDDLVLAERAFPGDVWVAFGAPTWPPTFILRLEPTRTLDITGLPPITPAGLTGGISVAVGDLDGDGIADLAIGIGRSDASGTVPDTIDVLRGPLAPGARDLSVMPADLRVLLPPLSHWVRAKSAQGLAAGDVDGDGIGDLLFGATFLSSVGGVPAGSSVRVLHGPLPTGLLDLQVSAPDLALVLPAGDQLGHHLTLDDVDRDGALDVIAGAPGEGPPSAPLRGTVAVAFGPLGSGVLDLADTSLPRIAWLRGPEAGARLGAGFLGGALDGSDALLLRSPGFTDGWAFEPPPLPSAGELDLASDPAGACAHDATPVLAADFDLDGRLDTAVTGSRATQWYLLNDLVVSDSRPPSLSVLGEPIELWPPNHRLVEFRLDEIIDVIDGCDPAPVMRFVSVTSNEPERGRGSGHTAPDVIVQDDVAWLRAEREGGGTGRIYTVTVSATDASGNEATITFEVVVKHDRRDGPLPPRGGSRRGH